jgi:hypothetical protein
MKVEENCRITSLLALGTKIVSSLGTVTHSQSDRTNATILIRRIACLCALVTHLISKCRPKDGRGGQRYVNVRE